MQAFDGTPPPDPIKPPYLIPDWRTGKAGQFIVDLSVAAPSQANGSSCLSNLKLEPSPVLPLGDDSVIFLFKFEEI